MRNINYTPSVTDEMGSRLDNKACGPLPEKLANLENYLYLTVYDVNGASYEGTQPKLVCIAKKTQSSNLVTQVEWALTITLSSDNTKKELRESEISGITRHS